MPLGKIPLVAVIGSPISHSKSPRLHNFWLKENGLDGYYIPLDVKKTDLKSTLEQLPKMGFVGANITVPYKEDVMSLVGNVSRKARLIRAANTLSFFENGKIYADNTDAYGFGENIKQCLPNWSANGGPAIVLGAGGAARAVIVSLLDAGSPTIFISNRTRARAEALKKEFGAKIKILEWKKETIWPLGETNILVNTTSLGMIGQPNVPMSLKTINSNAVVSDLVYEPLETGLLREAKEMGCRVVDGLGMLIHQAIPGFERWFGEKPREIKKARGILLK